MEKLTRELVEAQLMSFIELHSEVQRDGVTRWAWALSPMAGHSAELEDRELSFQYKSQETAQNYALGWIRRNRPDLEKAAVREAQAGINYRAYHSR
ncbi:hypothetical protein AA0N74_07890 [Chromobacterium vaccinii]|uniref:hypothetical protein n=1 Tax=Chromobacterium vaccinii TaxID=1108595 RepID=UPI0031E23F94